MKFLGLMVLSLISVQAQAKITGMGLLVYELEQTAEDAESIWTWDKEAAMVANANLAIYHELAAAEGVCIPNNFAFTEASLERIKKLSNAFLYERYTACDHGREVYEYGGRLYSTLTARAIRESK